VSQALPLVEARDTSLFGAKAVGLGEALREGLPVALTPQEFKMLRFMANNPERVVSREQLLNEVWGYQNYPSTRTVDNHVLRLRQKLEKDPANPVHFRTVHGAGYKFIP